MYVNKPRAVGPTTVPDPLTLRALEEGSDIGFESLLSVLWSLRYTGILTFDFRNGRPRLYAVGQPRRGTLVSPP